MKIKCPDCKWEFQVVDVDGVMSERKLIHEVLEAERHAKEMTDHSQMIQNARDAFDRECERQRSKAETSLAMIKDIADWMRKTREGMSEGIPMQEGTMEWKVSEFLKRDERA